MVFLIGVLYALVSGLTTVFVVPLMIQADSGVLAAWRRLWGSIKTAWKQYLAYVVIAFLLTVAAGIIASIVVGIVAIVLLIPILIVAAITHVTVSLSSTVGIAVSSHSALLFGLSMLVIWTLAQVPVVTYLRYYALLVLGDIEETFHILSDRQLSRRAMNDESSTWGSAARGAVALFVLRLIGVVALAIYSVPTLRAIPELAVLSYPTLMLVAAANSTIFLVIFVTLGTVTAPRTGLHSHVFAWASGGTRIGTRFDDHFPSRSGWVPCCSFSSPSSTSCSPVYRTRVGRSGRRRRSSRSVEPVGEAAALRTCSRRFRCDCSTAESRRRSYSGGASWPRSHSSAGASKPDRERTKTPPAAVMWVAIVASAVAFGVGHLPALASTFDLTIALIIRTVLLNAIVGVALGWLFWQRSLETAMVAHAAFHIVLVTVSTAGTLFF